MSDKDPRVIMLNLNGGHGDLLREATRAYMNTGNPSVMIRRVMEGVQKYKQETKPLSKVERAALSMVTSHLADLEKLLREAEDKAYGPIMGPASRGEEPKL